MRHRRWVVVLAILIIAVLPLGFLGLKVASRHPAVKRVVLSRMMPEVEGELTIGGLEMGLASLHFTDVMLQLEGGGYVLVPSAAVAVSLPKLLAGGLVPSASLSSMIISDPRIVITYGQDEGEASSRPSFDVTTLEAYLPDYIGISGASVAFRDERTARTFTIDSIDFLLERDGDGPAVGGASGNCTGGSGNFQAQFTWDGSTQTLSAGGTLDGVRLDESLPVPPSLPIEFTSGVASATFHASVSPDTVRGLEMGFAVDDAVVLVTALGETVTGVDARGRLRGGVATLESATGRWRTSSWAASGSTSESGAFDDVRLSAGEVPLRTVADLLELGELNIDGSADVSALVTGRIDDPTAAVTILASDVDVGGVALTEVSGSATLTSESVTTEGIEARIFGGVVAVSGSLLRGGKEEWSFDFEADATGLDAGRLVETATGDTTARGTISLRDVVGTGSLGRPNLESLLFWEDLALGPTALGSGAGGFLLSGGGLSVSLASSDRTYSAMRLHRDPASYSGRCAALTDGRRRRRCRRSRRFAVDNGRGLLHERCRDRDS